MGGGNPTEEPRLPFPTKPLRVKGVEVEEYVIPEHFKPDIFKLLYLFDPLPDMEGKFEDLPSGKIFRIRQFRIIREAGRNILVSPNYEEGGGTVLDWVVI